MASFSYVNKVRLIWRKISVEGTCINMTNSLEPSDANICWGNGMLLDGTNH